jgi:hypothetical protein
MKYMVKWAPFPGTTRACVERFLAGEAAPQEGVKLLGRWHQADCSGGYSLYETDQPEQLYRGSAKWTDLMHMETHLVLEDGEVTPVLMEVFKK